MERNDFYPFMKVSLNSEFGVVTDEFWEVKPNVQQGVNLKLYGVIRWDTNKQSDYEDWRGLWGSFVAGGGHEINKIYQFQFINDDGTLR